jgi:1-acyl-sn-glycerol-3-phosphate acyltransferase
MMETFLLPGFVQPIRAVTFIVKESLLNYPVFKHVMRSRNPIALTRTNPRQDLKTVMQEGVARLQNSISVIVFPQTTRAHNFDPTQMSSIGVKLAKKAGVPVIPLALKTDCWENGERFKDFGRINTAKKAYFSFGEPIIVESKGDVEQEKINNFISDKLDEWAD